MVAREHCRFRHAVAASATNLMITHGWRGHFTDAKALGFTCINANVEIIICEAESDSWNSTKTEKLRLTRHLWEMANGLMAPQLNDTHNQIREKLGSVGESHRMER